MSIMAVLLVLALWPFWGEKSFALFVLPFIFGELIHKFWYRKDLVCPHCGFDAAWYLKDIKMARKKISRFHELKGEQAEKEIKPVTQQDEIESSPPI
jgi:5-bromo-4-chloroindolyl phosphate hydrolysis protein